MTPGTIIRSTARRATQGGTAVRDGRHMERHREPLAAVVAALLVFAGIVAPALMLALAVTLAGVGLAVLTVSSTAGHRTDDAAACRISVNQSASDRARGP